MAFEVSRTTAEHVVAATDAALQVPSGVSTQVVAEFLDVPEDAAEDALKMAVQLGFVTVKQGKFVAVSPLAGYLVTSERQEKAAVLRLSLEQFEPYKTFRVRLAIEGLAPQAATQARALHGIASHRDVIVNTFVDLGTYANSLVSEGAGLYRPREEEPVSFLVTVGEVVQAREDAELFVRRRLGDEAADWVDNQNVIGDLATAYQRLAQADEDATPPVVHAGNAVESFLTQLAQDQGTNIANANGVNAKAERLKQAGALSTKHLNMLKYLGHLRNAADHGIDAEVNAAWQITEGTAVEYVHVAHSAIKASVAFRNGRHEL